MKRVYFLKPIGMDGPIKVGCSVQPEGRLKSLDIWSPFPLELIATAPGENQDERNIHWRLRDTRLHGEWFSYSPALANLISHVKLNGALPPLEKAPYGQTGKGRGQNPGRNLDWKQAKSRITRSVSAAERHAFGPRWRSCGSRPADIDALMKAYQSSAFTPPPTGAELERIGAYIKGLYALPRDTRSWQTAWNQHQRALKQVRAA